MSFFMYFWIFMIIYRKIETFPKWNINWIMKILKRFLYVSSTSVFYIPNIALYHSWQPRVILTSSLLFYFRHFLTKKLIKKYLLKRNSLTLTMKKSSKPNHTLKMLTLAVWKTLWQRLIKVSRYVTNLRHDI